MQMKEIGKHFIKLYDWVISDSKTVLGKVE